MSNTSVYTAMQEKLSVSAFSRHLLYGVVAGIVMVVFYGWNGLSGLLGNLFMGCCLSFFCWMGQRLWEYLVLPVIQNPHSPVNAMFRFTIWFLAGGIGYTFGLLIAKKNGLIFIADRPIMHHVILGGGAGIIFQILARIHLHHLTIRYR
jgi:hypothetical protein